VNEIREIRRQLNAERDRAIAIAEACARAPAGAHPPSPVSDAAIAAFHEASLAYLARVLAWFDERDQRLTELCARLPVDDPDRCSLENLLGDDGSGREAVRRLESAAPSPPPGENGNGCGSRRQEHWQEFYRFLGGAWKTRRDAIDRLLSSNLRVADWRMVAGIDADSILEERGLYAQVRQHLPPGSAATAGL
jgi:hypothetical protein